MHRWTADHIALLKRLWPVLTAAQIGRRMGLSREAICGKVHRLGLPSPKPDRLFAPKRGGNPPKAKYMPPPSISAPLVPQTVLPDMPAPEFLNRSIDELGFGECRYPRGECVPYWFCGQPCEEKSSFCVYHKRLAYHRPVPVPMRSIVLQSF
jgi:hypothetical protein